MLFFVLMDDENMEYAVNETAQDGQSGDGLAGIMSRFPIFDGYIGVGGVSAITVYIKVEPLIRFLVTVQKRSALISMWSFLCSLF